MTRVVGIRNRKTQGSGPHPGAIRRFVVDETDDLEFMREGFHPAR